MSNSQPIIVHLSRLKGSPPMSISLIIDPSMGMIMRINKNLFREYIPLWHI